jgi:hypothetical protein
MDNNVNDEHAPMGQDEILMKESDILAGLLSMGMEKANRGLFRKMQIKRDGVLKFEFRVRPISEEESQQCHRNATKYAKTKPGQPRIPLETNPALFRSYIIYTATADEDRAKVWDNPKALEAFNLLQGVDMVDHVLLAGEKSRVLEAIDAISGFALEAEETGKN